MDANTPCRHTPDDIPGALRGEIHRYLRATPYERASLFKSLYAADPSVAEVLIELEGDWTLRADFQVALMKSGIARGDLQGRSRLASAGPELPEVD
jgi:hypothetical protein